MDRFANSVPGMNHRGGHSQEVVKRKIALVLSSFPPGRELAQRMAEFLKCDLSFDHVTYSKGLSQAHVHEQFAKIRHEADSWNEDGILLVFVYYMGEWCLPNAEIAFTKDGDDINLKELTVELAANPKVHVVQWVEDKLGVRQKNGKPDSYRADPHKYQAGVQHWLSMHIGTDTKYFCDYYHERLSKMSKLCWPDDLVKAGFQPSYDASNKVIEHYTMDLNPKAAPPKRPSSFVPPSQSPYQDRTMPPQKHNPTDVLQGIPGPKP